MHPEELTETERKFWKKYAGKEKWKQPFPQLKIPVCQGQYDLTAFTGVQVTQLFMITAAGKWGLYQGSDKNQYMSFHMADLLHGYGAQLTFDGIWRGPEYGPVIYPKMSGEDWARIVNPEGRRKGIEEVLDYFMDYLSTEKDPALLIYAVWCTEGVKIRRLQELYVKLLDKYRTHENARFDYKGSQMVLRGGACLGASRPEGQLTSNLMRQFDYFGLDYRGGWKLLMDEGRWREWKQQSGYY